MDRSEKIIRSTDYDALSCRISAHKKHYLQDEYLQHIVQGFEKFLKYEYKLSSRRTFNSIVSSNKLPIINRGTYIRTKAIDAVIEKFIAQFGGEKFQVVNLGAGSDTRPFQLLQKYKNAHWVEFDFKDSTRLKQATILSDPVLAQAVGIDATPDLESLESFYAELDGTLTSERYKLIALDLRVIQSLKDVFETQTSKEYPTLVISECMLCYADSETSTEIIKAVKTYFTQGSFVIYDPIGGEGNFGNVMIDNLKMRNISMPSLLKYNTLSKYSIRLRNIGFVKVRIDNMFNIMNNWLDDDEKIRISRLEFLDELEELRLLLEHYCLIVAVWGFDWDIGLQFGDQ